MEMKGFIDGLSSTYGEDHVRYELNFDDDTSLKLNDLIGQEMDIVFYQNIHCCHCKTPIKKTYAGGYCYRCFISLAQCDICYIKPELCHYEEGTCREPKWGEDYCFQPHYVYISYTSDYKVGITRKYRIFNRWMEQGATKGIILGEVNNRKISGEVEVSLKKYIKDKTNWRKMLQESVYDVDMESKKKEMIEYIPHHLKDQIKISDEKETTIKYPILNYLNKITSINLEKTPSFSSKLMGLKGAYMIFEMGVLNIKKYAGYEIGITKD